MAPSIADLLADPQLLDPLVGVLRRARKLGFLGAASIGDHLVNGADFALAVGVSSSTATEQGLPSVEGGSTDRPLEIVDLGSGGGVPAFVVAVACPLARVTLVERGVRRCDFLREAVSDLGLNDRVGVLEGDAEVHARDPARTEQFDVVTARSFGPPAVTAEAGVRFLRVGGRLVVSDPPGDAGWRWPVDGLARLGLRPLPRVVGERTSLSVAERWGTLEARYPRRAATVRKRPLF
jgi:16S rRNA (guanine527-N7)-methyltransferase